MNKLVFSNVSFSDIEKCVDLKIINSKNKIWTEIEKVDLKKQVIQEAELIQSRLFNMPIHIMNEATIWGRAIYPLLLLAENETIQAWAGMPLKTQYKNFSLEGIVDGIFAESGAGYLRKPYFIVVEAKRGIEAKNPIPQLYAELLAVAMLNHQQEDKDSQRIFGCYTISDSWTFVQADVSKMASKRPVLKIKTSREYAEKYEAVNILKILSNIFKRILNKTLV